MAVFFLYVPINLFGNEFDFFEPAQAFCQRSAKTALQNRRGFESRRQIRSDAREDRFQEAAFSPFALAFQSNIATACDRIAPETMSENKPR